LAQDDADIVYHSVFSLPDQKGVWSNAVIKAPPVRTLRAGREKQILLYVPDAGAQTDERS
ncbi:MAG: hypothetical protein J6D22_04860, partial [Pyramidobacter sp.]|nr:hypothetical protein [Pyramidobacter sp.]